MHRSSALQTADPTYAWVSHPWLIAQFVKMTTRSPQLNALSPSTRLDRVHVQWQLTWSPCVTMVVSTSFCCLSRFACDFIVQLSQCLHCSHNIHTSVRTVNLQMMSICANAIRSHTVSSVLVLRARERRGLRAPIPSISLLS